MFQLHGWEAVLFYVLAFLTLIMGVFVVTARLAVHSALFLISTLVNIALLFILLRAEFVAGVQILVYVGGVMVLFLFVIMLVQTRAGGIPRQAIHRAIGSGGGRSDTACCFILFLGDAGARFLCANGLRSGCPG